MRDPARIENYKAVQYSRDLFPALCVPGVAKSRSPRVKLLQLTRSQSPPETQERDTLREALVHGSGEQRCVTCSAPLRKTVYSSWSSCEFSSAINTRVMSSLMLKGTLMVRTSVWMLKLMPLNIRRSMFRAHTQRSELTWSLSDAQTSESVTSQAVRSGVNHRKLYWFGR